MTKVEKGDTIQDTIFLNLSRDTIDEHWYWGGRVGAGGYATFRQGGTRINVARYLWDLTAEEPSKYRLRRTCPEEECFNPDHMEETAIPYSPSHRRFRGPEDYVWRRGAGWEAAVHVAGRYVFRKTYRMDCYDQAVSDVAEVLKDVSREREKSYQEVSRIRGLTK